MRIEGWEALLYDHIAQGRSLAFQWGQNDCALWCSDWVSKAIGVDFSIDWRGHYATEERLQELMLERGYAVPADIANEHLPSAHLAFASRGDIVLHPNQDSLGICDGATSFFLTAQGLTSVPTNRCLAAWKVE